MQQVYIGTPDAARELARHLIKHGVDVVALASVGNTGQHAVYVPEQDADMVKNLKLSRSFKAMVRRNGAA